MKEITWNEKKYVIKGTEQRNTQTVNETNA